MPSTYSRLVPQSPYKRPTACSQPTLRGRSLESIASAAGLLPPRPLFDGSIRSTVSFQSPTGLADGLGLESAPASARFNANAFAPELARRTDRWSSLVPPHRASHPSL